MVGSQWRLLLNQGCRATHPSQWVVPWQIPVDETSPRLDGAWCSQLHCGLIHSESPGSVCLPPFPHVYRIRCPAYGAIGPYLAKVALPASSLICCFHIQFSFLPPLLLTGYKEEGTSGHCHYFFFLPHLVHHDLCNVTPITICSMTVSIHGSQPF